MKVKTSLKTTFETNGPHDGRLIVTLKRGDTILTVAGIRVEGSKAVTLRVVGYDMLPHLMSPDGRNYQRIEWEQFRRLLTGVDHEGVKS